MGRSKSNLKINDNQRTALLQDLWLAENRGVFVQVAKQLKDVTPEAVRRVYRGLSESKRIRLALRRRGAPIAA